MALISITKCQLFRLESVFSSQKYKKLHCYIHIIQCISVLLSAE